MSAPDHVPPDDTDQAPSSRVERRRKKIADEIARNRRGEYRVPTWVLVLALVLLVGGWLALVLLS
jgi:hypothetical protein